MSLGELNIIGDVTDTISGLLSDLEVTLESPANMLTSGTTSFAKLNLYLYQVLENDFSKNQSWVTEPSGQLAYPPLALSLYYLLTPYASDPLTAHQVLSHTMRAFYDNSIISGSQLQPSLRPSVDQLAVVLCPLQLEELTRIWNALQSPYRLSVAYEVRIVLIESSIRRDPARVTTKVEQYGLK